MSKSTKGGRPPTYANYKHRRGVKDNKRRRRFNREMAHLRKLVRSNARRWAEFDRRWRIGYGPSWSLIAEACPGIEMRIPGGNLCYRSPILTRK